MEIQEIAALTSKAQLTPQDPTAYPFIFLEHAPDMAGSDSTKQEICKGLSLETSAEDTDGWRLYMRSKVAQMQAALKLRL